MALVDAGEVAETLEIEQIFPIEVDCLVKKGKKKYLIMNQEMRK